MKTILCFGDSNTWGYIPITGERYAFSHRWTSVLEKNLGEGYRVENEGLNGRTISVIDPVSPGTCGMELFEPCLRTHIPLALLVIMLGTNDSKIHLHQSAYTIYRAMERLIKTAKNPDYGAFEILIVAPPLVSEDIETRSFTFNLESREKLQALPVFYEQLANMYGCRFLDSTQITPPSREDGLHFSAEGHRLFGEAITKKVKEILKDEGKQ